MKLEGLNAMVLHRRPYRETSYLLDVLTLEWGKLAMVCKGVRNSKSDKKSLLQPFQPLSLSAYGRHELKNLSLVEATQGQYTLQGKALFSAMYLNELLNRALPREVPCPDVYQAYVASLQRLQAKDSIEIVLREFEFNLLTELGYGLDWTAECHSGEPLSPELYYRYLPESGFERLVQPDRGRNRFSGADLLKVAGNQWDKTSLSVAKQISRLAFSPILGSKPLKSRELFQPLERAK